MSKKVKSLGKSLNKVYTEAIPTLCAQNATLCDLKNRSELTRNTFIDKVKTSKDVTEVDKGVLLLLLEHGCRISEVINISSSAFKGNGRVYITGLKKSNNRLLTGVSYYESLFQFCSNHGRISGIFSRFYYYRLCVKLGIKFESGNSSKVSVTHAGRHLLSDGLSKLGVDEIEIGSFIGHRSQKSIKHYVENK